MKIQDIKELKVFIKNKKIFNSINICVTIIFLISLVLIQKYPILAPNLSICVEYDYVPDGTVSEFKFEMKDEYIEDVTSTTKTFNDKAIFNINPEAFKADSIKYYIGNVEEEFSIKNIKFYSGKFSKDDYLIGEIGSKELEKNVIFNEIDNYEYSNANLNIASSNSDSNLEFNKNLIEEYKAIINNPWKIKLFLTVSSIYIYFTFVLARILPKNQRKKLYFYSILLIAYIIITVLIFNKPDLLKDREIVTNKEGDAVDISLETESKQNFIVNEDGLKGININFNIKSSDVSSDEGDIIVNIYNSRNNEKIGAEMFPISEVTEEKNRQIIFDEEVNVGEYYLLVKGLGENLDDIISLKGYENNYYEDGQLDIEGEETNENLDLDIDFIYEVVNYKIIVWIIASILFLLCILIMEQKNLKISSKNLIISIYLLALTFMCYQINFYEQKVGNTPDEITHISYIAYLEETDKLIPDFSKMTVLKKVYNENEKDYYEFTETTNQLGHPSLYYHIMRLANGIESKDNGFVIDFSKLHSFSIKMGLVAILIILYIGYSRISRDVPAFHLVYVSIISSIPMFTYNISGINNDTLTLLGCAIFALGILRHSENKNTYITYILIALGMCMTVLGKVTAGAILAIGSLIYIIWKCLSEKNTKSIFNKEFFITSPIYLIAIIYFLKLYLEQGVFQPMLKSIDPETFYNSGFYVDFANRAFKSVGEYFIYFWKHFFASWTAIASHIALFKETPWYAFDRIVPIIICFTPLILFAFNKKAKYVKSMISLYIAIVLVAFLQFFNGFKGFFYTSGYLGAYQSRYYLCIIVILAFIVILILQKLYDKGKGNNKNLVYELKGHMCINTKKISIIIAIVMSILLVYGDFIYFLLNFTSYK